MHGIPLSLLFVLLLGFSVRADALLNPDLAQINHEQRPGRGSGRSLPDPPDRAKASSERSLIVQDGDGSGTFVSGSPVVAIARYPDSNALFDHWDGDAPVLTDPRVPRSPFSLPDRDTRLAAVFKAGPLLAPSEIQVNGVRVVYQLPVSIKAVVLRFHGTGGSAASAFSGGENRSFTQQALAAGYAVIALDSSNRIDKQWNPSYALSNPDVQNVQAVLTLLESRGLLPGGLPRFAQGTSNGGGFASRISALLQWSGQALVIASGVGQIVQQAQVPTFWSLNRRDTTLPADSVQQATDTAAVLVGRGIAVDLNVLEPTPVLAARFSRIEGLSAGQAQTLVENLRGANLLDSQSMLIANPLSQSNLINSLIPAGVNPAARNEVGEQLKLAWTEHEFSADFAHRAIHFFDAQLALNLTALWWNPAESGWGLALAHQQNTLFMTWYTYDSFGQPRWYIGPGLELQADGSYLGELYRFTGQSFAQISAGNVGAEGRVVGRVALRRQFSGQLQFDYTLDGSSQSKRIERYRFGQVPVCRFSSGTRSVAANRSDIWWNPLESGWGISLIEQDQTLLLAWYTYDTQRQPMWVLGTLDRQSDGSFSGSLNRPLGGTPFTAINGSNATTFPVPEVGSAAVRFIDGRRAEYSWTLDGVSQKRPIERFDYSSPGSDCM